MNKQMETFSISPPINLSEEGRWLLGVTSFAATNSVFKITFSFSIPGRWRTPVYLPEGIIDKLKNLLKLTSEKDIDLHVKEKKEAITY